MSNEHEAQHEIVIIDDSRINLQILPAMLSDLPNVTCNTFEDPKTALYYVLKNKPAMILTDQEMPGMTGLEVLQKVRAYYDKYDLPVIMITGSDSMELFSEAFEAGLNDFVGKPLEQVPIITRVKSHLDASLTIKALRAEH